MTSNIPLPDRDADKTVWRTWARTVRRHDNGADGDSRSRAIVEHLRAWELLTAARHVLTFLPLPGEPDLRELLHDGGTTWYVTRTWPEPELPLSVHAYRLDELERHAYGFRQPVATAARIDPERIDLVLVPGLAFDAVGTRLGHGRGYYDRLLAELRPEVARVGVAAAACLVPRLPRDAHDAAMDYLVTESGVRAIASTD